MTRYLCRIRPLAVTVTGELDGSRRWGPPSIRKLRPGRQRSQPDPSRSTPVAEIPPTSPAILRPTSTPTSNPPRRATMPQQ